MNNNVSPIEKARELLRQIELKEVSVSTLPDNSEVSESSGEGPGIDTSKAVEKTELGSLDAYTINTKTSENILSDIFSLQQDDVLRGFVYSEILSRPRAIRKGRW